MNRTKTVNFEKVCRHIAKTLNYRLDRVKQLIEEKGVAYFDMGIEYKGFGEYEIDLDYRRY